MIGQCKYTLILLIAIYLSACGNTNTNEVFDSSEPGILEINATENITSSLEEASGSNDITSTKKDISIASTFSQNGFPRSPYGATFGNRLNNANIV